MALRSAVAPLLSVLLAAPARADAAMPAPTTTSPTTPTVPSVDRDASGPVAVASPEHPTDAPPPDASPEALYNAGEQAYWLGDFRRAVDLFEAAYARSGLPALLYNVGLATMRRYELTQDPADLRRARAVLVNYQQELARDPTLQQADNVPRLLAQLDATLATLATTPVRKPAPTTQPAIDTAAAPPQARCDPSPGPARSPDTRRAGVAIMTVGGLALAGGVASTLAFALKGQSFQHQQEKLLADAAARGCTETATSAGCQALEQARSITVDNGQRANLLAGGLGGGLMAIGLAGLVVGAVVFSRAPSPRSSKLAVTPSFTPRFAGLALSGSF